jgi:hypothetical protein
MNIAEALERARGIIAEVNEGWKITIETWSLPEAGLRIAEISGTQERDGGLSGWSYMQSDSACAGVIFAAERYVLDLMHFPDDAPDSEFNLREALTR